MSSIGQGSISIDDSTRIGENAQDTANKVAGNVSDINSDNKLTPTEKLKLKQEYDKDSKLYAIDVSQLQSAGIPTVELDSALSNLTNFVTPLFKEMNATSTVDRGALNSVFTAFATADKNASQAFVNMVQQAADDAKKAGDDAKAAGAQAQAAGEAASQAASQAQSDATQAVTMASQATSAADNAFSRAQAIGSQASSTIAVQSAATAKAQSTADSAFSQAKTAIDNGKVTSQAVTNLKDGSTLTIAELENGLASKVSNSDYATYKTQTANQIGQMVTNSNFSAYQQTTADLISSKVATKDFNTYTSQTAKAISSKVESSDFQAYQTQVNDSSVGTNLLLNTGDDNDASHPVKMLTGDISVSGSFSRTEEYSQLTPPPSTAPEMYYRFGGPETNEMHGLEPGQTYTIQGEVSVSKGAVRFRSQRMTTGGWADYDKGISSILVSNSDSFVHVSYTFTVPDAATAIYTSWQVEGYDSTTILRFRRMKLEKGSVATDFSVNPLDTATKSQITQLSGQIDQKVDSGDFSSYKTQTASLIGSKVDNGDFSTYKTQTANTLQTLVGRSPSNIIKDGGFNSAVVGQIPSGWDFSGTAQIAVNSVNTDLVATGRSVLQINSKTNGNSDIYYGDWFDVQSGDQFYAELKARWSSMSQKGRIVLGMATKDATGKWIWTGAVIIGSPSNWAKYTGILTIPNGAVQGRIWVAWQGPAAANEAVFVTDLVVRPAYSTQSDITQAINNIHLGVKNADGSTSTFNMNGNTILMDTAQTIINGKTSILDASIDTAKIANAAINTAQIADGAINNAKIANAAINDAKISNLNGNKIVAGSITADKINVDDLIANGINTKTLTSVNLNTSTLTTPQLDLGFNGTFTEDFDYTQATTMFLPKKNKGTLTFNHGVLQSKGNMQTYVGGQWGGMNSNYNFQAGIDNSQWTEVAPGYIKLDLFRQDDANFVERTYIDPTGYYYKSGNGIASYLGNILQTSQVQTPSVLAKYIGPSDGELRLQIGSNGKDFGLQVGSYGGGEGVLSDFIYNTTSSGSSNVHITENGRLVRTTSASKYKYNIKNPDIETTLGDRLLNVHMATWNDKRAVDMYAEQLSTGEDREKASIDEYYGLIAEQLRDAGLDMFISYGKNHEIEGIQYDRAWVPLLSVIRRLNDKVNEYELRLSKLEGASK